MWRASFTPAERLNDLWNAFRADATDQASVSGADSASLETLASLYERDDAQLPDPHFLDRLERQLLETASATTGTIPSAVIPPASPNGHVASGLLQSLTPRPGAEPRTRHWTLAHLATAALIVLTLVGGLVATGSLWHLPGTEQQAVIIPAVKVATHPALPAGVTADDVVLRATLEEMPSGNGQQTALNRYHLAPGAVQPVGSQADTGVGLDLFTVEEGQVTVEADGPVFLTRAVASSSAVPSLVQPGTAVVLAVGDQLYAPNEVSYRRRNDGSIPATVLDFSIGTVGNIWYPWTEWPTGLTYDTGLPYKIIDTEPAGSADASVHRFTIEPGAEIALRDLPGLELVYVEAGALDLVYAKPETPATPERVFTIGAGSGTDTFGRTPERAVLANRGTEPLVLLTASIVPAKSGVATLPEAKPMS